LILQLLLIYFLIHMKTFLFCTSYFDNEADYKHRYAKWAAYYSSIELSKDDPILMIDDGSDLSLVEDEYFAVIKADDISEDTKFDTEKVNLIHFDERSPLHRDGQAANSAGWWRSYLFSLEIAKKLNFEKIIHVESDLYLISTKIRNFIDELEEGWTSFLCNKYHWPESSLQIICKDHFEEFEELSKELDNLGLTMIDQARGPAENLIPFSCLLSGFNGSRYGETMVAQMPGMDYFAQCKNQTIIIPEISEDD